MKHLENAVSRANVAFFEAFRDRDIEGMRKLWAREFPVVCTHPGMTPIHGLEAVLRSWRGILRHPKAPQIQCLESRAVVLGSSGIVTALAGTKKGDARLVTTNVFVFEAGHWRLVSHQSAPLNRREKAAGDGEEPSPSTDPFLLN